MSEEKDIVLSSAIWRMLERVTASGVTFIISAILARILTLDEYGVINLVLVFTTILQVFMDSGLGRALIQKKDATNKDFSTIFFLNCFLGIVLYVLLFFSSPYIEFFFGINELSKILRISSVIVLISSVKNVLQSYIMKNMQFRLFFKATLLGTVVSGIVALYMAYAGYGIWALVAQIIINPLIDTITLWILIDWHPSLEFSWRRLKLLLSYGWKLLLSDLLNEIFNSLRTIIIGKFYTTSELGCYENGRKLPTAIYSNLDSSLRSVIFPVLAKQQDDKEKTKEYMLKMINVCYFTTIPILFGLMSCSENVVLLLWGKKWMDAVPYMQITCLIWALNSIQAINQQVILTQGRSDICLRIEMINKIVAIIFLVFAVRFGVLAIAISQLLAVIVALFVNLYPNKGLINCNYSEQFKSCYVEVLIAFVMSMAVYFVGKLRLNCIIELILQVIVGMIFYCIPSILLKREGYIIIKDFLLRKIKKR